MLDIWDNAIVTDINLAMYVAPGTGTLVHTNRSFHGFVMNDGISNKNIHFSNGTVLKTGEYEFHYLPKGSDYRVENIIQGGCWAINFNLLQEIEQTPFHLQFRNPEPVIKIFKDAVTAWQEKNDFHNAKIRKCIYDIIDHVHREQQRNYIPSQKELIIKPAIEYINKNFTDNNIKVHNLAELCGISEAYFRRIFTAKFSTGPKDYIINLRIRHAKRLLESGQFSVSEIAEMCGYFEPCHFSREFRKIVGKSPKEYP